MKLCRHKFCVIYYFSRACSTLDGTARPGQDKLHVMPESNQFNIVKTAEISLVRSILWAFNFYCADSTTIRPHICVFCVRHMRRRLSVGSKDVLVSAFPSKNKLIAFNCNHFTNGGGSHFKNRLKDIYDEISEIE